MKPRTIVMIPTLGVPVITAIILGLNGGGWYYLSMILGAIFLLVILEIISLKKRGKTISRDIAESPKWVFWSVVGGFLTLGIGMAIHWILYLK